MTTMFGLEKGLCCRIRWWEKLLMVDFCSARNAAFPCSYIAALASDIGMRYIALIEKLRKYVYGSTRIKLYYSKAGNAGAWHSELIMR